MLIGYYDAKPSCWRDDSSKPRGIFIDVAKAIAERRGWEVSFVYDTWDGLIDRLKTNRVDFVPAIVRTPEREAFAVFTEESVMTDWGVVYARRGGPIRSMMDLDGKRVGALENDYWFSGPGSLRGLASAFGLKPVYRFFPDYTSLFHALGRGEVDAAAGSNSLGIIWEADLPIEATPVIYNPIELRFASPRDSSQGLALAREMDKGISELRELEPGRLRRILAAYAVPLRRVFQTPLWASILLAGLASVLVAIVVALARRSRALRHSVEETRSALERLDRAKGELERGLGEKELLVHELSHRVKNNLQLVLSLMGLLSDGRDESSERLLRELREKVFAISQAEEELFDSAGIGQASVESLVSSIVARLASGGGAGDPGFGISIDLRGRSIAAAAATPFSLIAYELLANAYRHGKGADGSLRASLRVETREDGSGEIEAGDAGPGFPRAFDPRSAPGLGLRLVLALASQLEGGAELSRSPGGGARVLVTIPARNWSTRVPVGSRERAGPFEARAV